MVRQGPMLDEDGKPKASWSVPALQAVTWWVIAYPRHVVVASLCMTVVALVVTWLGLGFRTSRLDLLNPSSEFNQRWLAYLDEFRHTDDLILVVHDPDPERVRQVIDYVAQRLRTESSVDQLFYRIDLTPLRRKGLYYLESAQLDQMHRLLQAQQPALRGDWQHYNLLARVERWLALSSHGRAATDGAGSDAAALVVSGVEQELARLAHALAAPEDPSDQVGPSTPMSSVGLAELSQLGVRYLASDDGTYAWILMRIAEQEEGEFAHGQTAITRLREVARDAAAQFSGIEIGTTGLPVMEYDEMVTSQSDMTRSAIVSLIAVGCVFSLGFGSLWYPLLAVATLVIAMVWSFAGAASLVGHLNILSVSFSVILIGLGIDFGIHYLSRYRTLRATGSSGPAAVMGTATSVGPALVAGGLTTALAFGTASLTEFTGVAELGVIAAQGIVLCIGAALIVLPALLLVWDRHGADLHDEPIAADRLVNRFLNQPSWLLLVALVVTGVVALRIDRVWYDHNLLHLQAEGLESVVWEHRLLDQTHNSAWYAISVSPDRDTLLQRKRALETFPSVARCEEIVSLVPDLGSDAARPSDFGTRVEQLARQLASVPATVPQLEVPSRDRVIATFQQFGRASLGQSRLAGWWEHLRIIQQRLHQMSRDDYFRRVTQYQQVEMERDLARLRQLQEIASPDRPTWDDIPTPLRERFVGRHQTYLLKVFAKENVWDMEALRAFVSDVETIDPKATGQPIQTYYASRQMRESYVRAAGYCLIAVTIVLLLDLRHVGMTLLAMLPVVIGSFQLVGLLGWFQIALNPANMIVLPLILGIGIDDGVHIMHDYLRQSGKYRLSRSTAAAVVITSLTTMAGFGSLMLARHRGLQSLGQVLTLGVACCLVSSLWILPALLSLLPRREESRAATSPIEAELNRIDRDD